MANDRLTRRTSFTPDCLMIDGAQRLITEPGQGTINQPMAARYNAPTKPWVLASFGLSASFASRSARRVSAYRSVVARFPGRRQARSTRERSSRQGQSFEQKEPLPGVQTPYVLEARHYPTRRSPASNRHHEARRDPTARRLNNAVHHHSSSALSLSCAGVGSARRLTHAGSKGLALLRTCVSRRIGTSDACVASIVLAFPLL